MSRGRSIQIIFRFDVETGAAAFYTSTARAALSAGVKTIPARHIAEKGCISSRRRPPCCRAFRFSSIPKSGLFRNCRPTSRSGEPPARNADLYRDGDVCVQPSHWEGLGLQLLECQAAGMPLVTTDAPPMNECRPYRAVAVAETEIVHLNGDEPLESQLVRPEDLAAVLESIFDTDIGDASEMAREFIERERSWPRVRDTGCGLVAGLGTPAMQWHRLPPRNPDECRFRRTTEHDSAGESAICELVRMALPLAEERICQVALEACLTCCKMDPAAPATWNTVVASLVYQAASAVAADPGASSESLSQAAKVRIEAEYRLELDGILPDAEARPVQQFNSLRELIPPPAKRREAELPNGRLASPRLHGGRRPWNAVSIT